MHYAATATTAALALLQLALTLGVWALIAVLLAFLPFPLREGGPGGLGRASPAPRLQT